MGFKFSLEAFEAALASLEDAMMPPPRNDRERDGAIQRFEYTLEVAWKSGQKLLNLKGVEALSPKAVFRELAKQKIVNDAQRWIDYVDARNTTSHIYKKSVAEYVFSHIGTFVSDAKDLLNAMRTDIDASDSN